MTRKLTLAAAVFLGLSAVVGASVEVGGFATFAEQTAASVPAAKSGRQRAFIDSADHKLKRKDSTGTITTIEGGGGGGTTQTIDVINATAATGKTITSAVADSGTNVGIIFNNSTALTGTTLLASFQNNSVEKLAIEDDGTINGGTVTKVAGTDLSLLNSGSSGFVTSSGGGNVSMRYAGNDILVVNGGGAYPAADGAKFFGTPGNRWGYTSAYYHETKLGAQLTAAATITPTTGLHHVTGGTSITTIALTNFAGNPEVTLVADGGTITLTTGGNIAAGVTIAQDKAQKFVYDGTSWYAVQ